MRIQQEYFQCAVAVFVLFVAAGSIRATTPPQRGDRASNRKSSWADRVNLDDLVPYTQPSAAWSDRYSDVAITWTRPDDPGIQQLEAVVGWAGTKITDDLLSWKVSEDGKTLPLKLKHRNFRPDKIVESDETSDLSVSASAAFPEWNTIAVRFSLVNRSNHARIITVEFDYPGKGVRPDWGGPFPAEHFVSVEGEPEGSWSTIYVHHEHGRNVGWVNEFATGMTDGTTLEMVCLADLSARKLQLAPHGQADFTVVMATGRNRGRAREAYRAATRKIKQGWTPDENAAHSYSTSWSARTSSEVPR